MLPYFEIHLTVNLKDKSLEDFKKTCEIIDSKAIVINLEETQQVMTSKTVQCSPKEIYQQALQDIVILQEHGFEVIRSKIETDKIESNVKYDYAEIHVPCHTRKLIEYPNIANDLPLFDLKGNQIKGHISRNEFKPNVTFITWRAKRIEDFEYFNLVYNRLMELYILADPNKDPKLEIIIHDTNEKLDSEWMNI